VRQRKTRSIDKEQRWAITLFKPANGTKKIRFAKRKSAKCKRQKGNRVIEVECGREDKQQAQGKA